ncbi:MAG: peptidase U32 family protein, partial [Pseudanabaenaceae cyanobacterium]
MLELLAPAGNWDCAKAAVANGADAIYFGLDQFNARMRADNFTLADLPALLDFLHGRGVRGYVTLNTLIFPRELETVEAYLKTIIGAGVDAAIVQDVGLCCLIRHLSPDFPIHASTQMTITSAAGVNFAQRLSCNLVVLARECSISEIRQIEQQVQLPLEVFVHGALCVAYSGQCLTSEALGGRSANRGECAQACRMPYELIVDGKVWDTGDRKYLLSPQDLAGVGVLKELLGGKQALPRQAQPAGGIVSLKIEGRLKTPEYVAAVTKIYRQAIDRLLDTGEYVPTDRDWYTLAMTFSRGLYTGWLEGIDNQKLVHGRYGKKRGVYLGQVQGIRQGKLWLRSAVPIHKGDGIAIVRGEQEWGGRVYAVITQGKEIGIALGRQDVDVRQIKVGDEIWKTSDPKLEQELHQTYKGEIPRQRHPLTFHVTGAPHQPLTITAQDSWGHQVCIESPQPLQPATTQPLTYDRLWEQLSRLGNTPFYLAKLTVDLQGDVILPVSTLNQMRRTIVAALAQDFPLHPHWQLNRQASYRSLLPPLPSEPLGESQLLVLVRNLDQLRVALDLAIPLIYCELEDPRRCKAIVNYVRQGGKGSQIWVAPPRITKPGEQWILQQVLNSQADGYLIRNYDHLEFFRAYPLIGDFSFNVANPLTAQYFLRHYPLQRLTCSYDLNIDQLTDLVQACPRHWLEVTIHQHMPLFHMEHCVFCTF